MEEHLPRSSIPYKRQEYLPPKKHLESTSFRSSIPYSLQEYLLLEKRLLLEHLLLQDLAFHKVGLHISS